ncbi:MAG: redox-sensing transcriptional repressor Rex [Bacillota bacterium]|nr:redox-sensing transcriptional repressor Rex [Candidatus Fermentithermobacillaceae bacterium]
MIRNRIPDVVVKRLVTYLRVLLDSDFAGSDFVSSAQLGDMAAVNGAQVRKDLALFGEFGKQGVGYPVQELKDQITKILGADRDMPVAVFGIGELGTAIVRYLLSRGRSSPNYRFGPAALFDEDKRKVGTLVEGLVIHPLSDLEAVRKAKDLKIGIITVPASAAQEVVDRAVSAGLKGFLNFAPAKLKVPPHVRVHYTDVTLELQELAFYLQGSMIH